MSALHVFMAVFGSIALGLTIWANWRIVGAPRLRHKPLWIVGSLFAFVGFTINWSAPDELYMWFGVQIPFFSVTRANGAQFWIAKIGVPIIAIIALVKIHRAERALPHE